MELVSDLDLIVELEKEPYRELDSEVKPIGYEDLLYYGLMDYNIEVGVNN